MIANTNALGGGNVDNAAVNAAIAEDPAATRAAAKIGQGPYADNVEAAAAGVGVGEIYRQPSGVVRWLDLDSSAATYQDTHGIADLPAVRLSEFLRGLTELGIRENLLDAAVYRADSQPSGSVAASLLGLSNLTLYGSPTKARAAIVLNGTSQYLYGPIVSNSGARSFLPIYSQSRYWGASDANLYRMQVAGAIVPRIHHYVTAGTSGLNAVYFDGSTAREMAAGGNRASALVEFAVLRDRQLGSGVSGSITTKTFRNNTGSFSSESTAAGINNYTLTRICMGASTLDGSSATLFNATAFPGWLLFGKALSDQETNDVLSLLADTVFPKFVMVIEGDSISDDLAIGIANEGNFRGQNMILREVADGGQTAAQGVAALGGGTGLTDANLNGGGYPVICSIAFGANDLGNFTAAAMPVSTIHANLRTLWAYAKARGAVVAASTVMNSTGIASQGRESDRITLNALIAADAGTYYDVLIDRDAWANSATATRPYTSDTSIFRDGIHLNMSENMGNALLCRYMGETLATAGYIP